MLDLPRGDLQQHETTVLRVAPKIIQNNKGYSDWFVYVGNPDASGNVDQNLQGYILSDKGIPLVPVVNSSSGNITYFEVVTRESSTFLSLIFLEGLSRPFCVLRKGR